MQAEKLVWREVGDPSGLFMKYNFSQHLNIALQLPNFTTRTTEALRECLV